MAGFTSIVMGSKLYFVVQADISPSHNCKKHSKHPVEDVTAYGISYIHKNTGRHLQA